MAKKKKSGGAGGGSGMPAGYDQVASGLNQWNTNANQWAGDAIDYSQNNQWAQQAQDSGWYQNMLSGGMNNNPWESRLYDQTNGLDMNRGLEYLEDFLGGTSGDPRGGGGAGSIGTSRGGTRYGPVSGGGGGGGSSSSSSSYGGHIPDSTVGNKFFSDKVNRLFDPSNLDPANDPTMQPMIDAIQRESEESYWKAVTDINNQAEGGGRYGGSLYQGMRAAHADEYHEALQGTMAQQYQQARAAALERQMQALGLVNTRDIAEGQIGAQLEAANIGANASMAGSSAAAKSQNDAMRLQAMQMMLGAGQFGMTMGGNMAELRQNGQIAANQIGQGWSQIGQHGYDQAGQFGQLGVGALGQLGNIYSDAASQRAAQQRLAEQQRQWNEGASGREMDEMIRMMSGLSDMGGYNYDPGYMPQSPGPQPGGFDFGDALGSILGGYGTYTGMQQNGGH